MRPELDAPPPATPRLLLAATQDGGASFVTAPTGATALTAQTRAAQLADLSSQDRELFYLSLSPAEMHALRWDWKVWARPQQLEPEGDWSVWLALAGRGFGKTRLGAEWIRANVCGPTPLARGRASRIALVGETAADVRDVMVKGSDQGILAVHPPEFRPVYIESKRRLEWPNGAVALTFSAEDPDQLRGPEHDLAWSDELAKWRYAEETWDMLQFGLRVGDNPRQLATTTPRPIPIVRELLSQEGKPGGTIVTRGSTFENEDNLARKFLDKVRDKYDGTRLGRQELYAEVLDDVPGALWTASMLERRTERNPTAAGMSLEEAARIPDLLRCVVAVDPSGTSGEAPSVRRRNKESEAGDDIGIVVAGLGVDGVVYILEDATVNWGPADWARRVVSMYDRHMADMVVAENNFGGAMVEHTVKTERRNINYRAVVASRGKVVRAEPVAALYEQGRVRHVGAFAALEEQMKNMTRQGYEGKGSPDRVDALVWAITDLVFGRSTRGGSKPIVGLG